MKAVIVVVLFLVALGVTLYALDVFPSGAEVTVPPPPVEPSDPSTPPPKEGELEGIRTEPGEEPPAEITTLDRPLRILLVGRYRDKVNVSWTDAWNGQPQIQYRAFWHDPKSGDPAAPHKGLEALTDAPGPEALEETDVVALYMVDPARIPPRFFERLAEKVRDRSIGLLVFPREVGGAILDQPAMKSVLPIESAKPFQGDPLPGVSTSESPFYVTAAGAEHPATRIVPFKGWSERIWAQQRMGEKPWGTKFVYPVERVKPGASVLLEVDVPRQGRIPAIVQGAPAEGRVLWVGVPDFGDRVWYDSAQHRKASALMFQWIVWLAGRTT